MQTIDLSAQVVSQLTKTELRFTVYRETCGESLDFSYKTENK